MKIDMFLNNLKRQIKKNFFNNLTKSKIFSAPIVSAIMVYFILQLIISGLLIYFLFLNYSENQLTQTSNEIINDLSYNNGEWNVSKYNADPNIPEKSPLYIITSQGYVIDRMNPIHGYLDKSNIFRLASFSTPQTVNTIENESWRVFSKEIKMNGNIWGIILVAHYNPDPKNVKVANSQLRNTAENIFKKLYIKNNQLNASKVNVLDFNYNISFEVVDQYNNILLKSNNLNYNNKLPDYIDRSYVGSTLSLPQYLQVKDTTTHQIFLVKNNEIKDKHNNVIAIVSLASSITYIYQLIEAFVIIEIIIGILLLLLLITFIHNSINIYISNFLRKNSIDFYDQKKITRISFSKKKHTVYINDKSVNIPFATNQYYFCDALFSNPTKKWETDELLDKFGEQDLTKWHKVYDTMKLTNKRFIYMLPDKLFIISNKRFQINPIFQNLIEYNK